MTLEVVIHEFTDDDLRPLRELFASYFPEGNRLLTPEYSLWLYAANPFGKALMVKVLQESRWVGFMAMIPVTLTKAAETLPAYYVVNVLVHPDFHGKNLFGRMIKAAMVRVDLEGAALLGHPNDMALKSWQRAQMHFQEALRPSLAVPRLWPSGYKARRCQTQADLEVVRSRLPQVLGASPFWRVAATPEYLNWRFLQHPTNRYVMQLIEHRGSVTGVQVSKRIRPGVSLLIDQFVPEGAVAAATSKLPAATICFLPDGITRRSQSGKRAIPLKKRIPFFMTRPGEPVEALSTGHVGLSSSDF